MTTQTDCDCGYGKDCPLDALDDWRDDESILALHAQLVKAHRKIVELEAEKAATL